MGIVVFGASLMDIKGYPFGKYVADGRNAGKVVEVQGGVSRNVAEDIANVELKPTYVSVLDHSSASEEIIAKLKRHKVNTDYIVQRDGAWANGWQSLMKKEMWLVPSPSGRIFLPSAKH